MKDKPAFPISDWAPDARGMTLREWYAGMALQGIMANASEIVAMIKIATPDLDGKDNSSPHIANYAFNLADAMLGVDDD